MSACNQKSETSEIYSNCLKECVGQLDKESRSAYEAFYAKSLKGLPWESVESCL